VHVVICQTIRKSCQITNNIDKIPPKLYSFSVNNLLQQWTQYQMRYLNLLGKIQNWKVEEPAPPEIKVGSRPMRPPRFRHLCPRQVQNSVANERDRVCDCWQFSRGKEIREQEFYYETIALLILIGKSPGQSPSRKYRSSTKSFCLVSTEYFLSLFLLR